MIINSNIKSNLEERSKKLEQSHIEIGLLIGQESEINDQQTYVLGFFPTPLNVDDDNKPINIESILSIDKEWVLEYCHQINLMLYGGIDIVGIYMITADSETLNEKNNESFIMKLLKSIHIIINSKSLQFISFSKKTGLINGKSTNSSQLYRLKSTELKVINNLETEFLSLHCILPIDINLKSNNNKNGMISFENVKKDIKEIFENQLFKESIILIENELANDNEIISKLFKSKSNLKIDLLINQLDSNLTSTSSLQFNFNNNNNNNNIHNKTHCIAYIHQLEQVKTAIKFIKKDIIKSVESRFDLLFNEIHSNKNEDKIKLSKESPILELPRRVNIQWLSNDISICDYLSSDETIEDCCKTITDLLQIDSPKINSIESSKNNEKLTTKKNITEKKENEGAKKEINETKSQLPKQSSSQNIQTKQTNNLYFIIIISVLVLMMAFYFKFFV
ncbi:hypothetical protein RB653_001468 [Dictyostelium firmibasis]|uniref:Protein odr-4 homolog n=1 Tax=Dictyostelium firmibasis TaxID=79012 RepID=A0AAN7Z246_9MYCE